MNTFSVKTLAGHCTAALRCARHLAARCLPQVLENRLQIAEQRFSETLSRNKELREDIDALSKQRQAADAVRTAVPASPSECHKQRSLLPLDVPPPVFTHSATADK